MKRKILYALVTTNCNLSCKYCDIKDKNDNFNYDEFINKLDIFDGDIILFGGEPTLYQDRLFDIYYSYPKINNKIKSITTNLMSINNKLITLFQIIGNLGTSWNPDRFNNLEYEIWLNNINKIAEVSNLKISVLITLVDSVINLTSDEFYDIISKWNFDIIKSINFEHYVGPEVTQDYFEKCDNWLCEIYKKWNINAKIKNENRVKHWYNDCSEVYTLYPDGKLINRCPHNLPNNVPTKCYNCDRVSFCKPCQLQKYCTFPFKFYDLISKNEKNVRFNI